MKNAIECAVLAIAMCTAGHAYAQSLTTRTGEGSPLKTYLGSNVTLNKNSSLNKQWVYIHDPKSPAEVEGPTNIEVEYDKNYLYLVRHNIKAKQDIRAIELIHVIVDVFGRQVQTLRKIEVADAPAGSTLATYGEWRIWTEADAVSSHTSFTYIRSVRTADGKVYFAPMAQVLDVIRKGAPSLTSSDIEPKKVEPK